MKNINNQKYEIIISDLTLEKVKIYHRKLIKNDVRPGAKLQQKLRTSEKNLPQLTSEEFLNLIVQTKSPQIFAESEIWGDGRDWNFAELEILGDVNCVVPVTVFDNGIHKDTKSTPIVIHKEPLDSTLLFSPGALLRNENTKETPDIKEVIQENGQLNFDKFYSLYERRLLPLLIYANNNSFAEGKKAFVTLPGMGCGAFAGKLQGKLEKPLQDVLEKILETHKDKLSNIAAVYYDPYSDKTCKNERKKIGNTNFLVRPLLAEGNLKKSQLCHPKDYEEQETDNFSDCKSYSIVAWDHVSYPGNDAYIGSRQTDDGVKACATNTFQIITGIEGGYDAQQKKYLPPNKYKHWKECIDNNHINFDIKNKTSIVSLKTGEKNPLKSSESSFGLQTWKPTLSIVQQFKDDEFAHLINTVLNHDPYSKAHLSPDVYSSLGEKSREALYNIHNNLNINIQIEGVLHEIHFHVFNPIWKSSEKILGGLLSKTPPGISSIQQVFKNPDSNYLDKLLAIHELSKKHLSEKLSPRSEKAKDTYEYISKQTELFSILEIEEKNIKASIQKINQHSSSDEIEILISRCANYAFMIDGKEGSNIKNIFEEKRMHLIASCQEKVRALNKFTLDTPVKNDSEKEIICEEKHEKKDILTFQKHKPHQKNSSLNKSELPSSKKDDDSFKHH